MSPTKTGKGVGLPENLHLFSSTIVEVNERKKMSDDVIFYVEQQLLMHKLSLHFGYDDISDIALYKSSQSEKIRLRLKSLIVTRENFVDDVFTDDEVDSLLNYYHWYLYVKPII
jgi:hypothetical protein